MRHHAWMSCNLVTSADNRPTPDSSTLTKLTAGSRSADSAAAIERCSAKNTGAGTATQWHTITLSSGRGYKNMG
jgi:hypothetical protein